ncbi:fluoride efflux transporter CrcB [Pseudorhizobium endolithicum]|uniref:Fluoride-specific ion channel FluC n=1 Tax=Pseudorhizobium endolithicum TaxID=1191678 RepID=A0ABN7JXB2_9HYPH|nr:fluoride efflux transporter CrcB [Pseudorhizobium endolithicum]CAD6415753.1 fluoride efflux transporter CrcB [Rhizobium sp. Q54]CAD7046002.1 fluoride efflux transporter CrcB [Pseudorhizobium endolithicum]
MLHVLLVALGGAIGSVCRHVVGHWSLRILGPAFPWGTLVVNVAGSFVIGLLAELIARRLDASVEMRLFLMTGFLGGFTTFSAFSLDALALFERGALAAAGTYVLASVCLSLAAVLGGLALGRSMF